MGLGLVCTEVRPTPKLGAQGHTLGTVMRGLPARVWTLIPPPTHLTSVRSLNLSPDPQCPRPTLTLSNKDFSSLRPGWPLDPRLEATLLPLQVPGSAGSWLTNDDEVKTRRANTS